MSFTVTCYYDEIVQIGDSYSSLLGGVLYSTDEHYLSKKDCLKLRRLKARKFSMNHTHTYAHLVQAPGVQGVHGCQLCGRGLVGIALRGQTAQHGQ